MKEDVVARAARALRQTTDGSSSRAASSRSLVVVQAITRRRRRHRLVVMVAPIAAVLLASGAWAAVMGRLPRWIDALRSTSAPATAKAPRGGAPAPRAVESSPRAVAEPEPSSGGVQPEVPPRASAVAVPRPTPLSHVTTTRASGEVALPAAPLSEEEALYSVAHRAHFVAHDPGAALRAWDAYLASYPAGRFALEARYNRALSLVRLGRVTEARVALEPFADGRSGGYRAAEARELLDALPMDADR